MQDFDAIKEHFKDSDPETRAAINALERDLKYARLYADLAKHDGVVMILKTLTAAVVSYDAFLRDQTAEDLAKPSAVAHRAHIEGCRESFAWFARLFSAAVAKEGALEKRADELRSDMVQ